MHLRINDGVVVEVIVDVQRQQVPAPEPFPEGYEPSALEAQQHAEQQALHDNFVPGPVPMAERFHPDFLVSCMEAPEGVEVQEGWLYDGQSFSAPPPPEVVMLVPQVVSQRQAHLALLEAGFYQTALSAIEAIVDPTEKLRAQIEWKSPTYERHSPFLIAFWQGLGQQEADLDALFIAASQK